MWMYRKKERWGEKRTEMVEVLLLVIYIWTANWWVWVFFIYHKMKLSLVFSFPVEMRWFLVFYISSWDEVILPLGCAFLPFCNICRCGLLERKIICEREEKWLNFIYAMLELRRCWFLLPFCDICRCGHVDFSFPVNRSTNQVLHLRFCIGNSTTCCLYANKSTRSIHS